MSLPGSTVTARTTTQPRSAAVDSSVFFVAGITAQGPTAPQTLKSIDDYAAIYGARVSQGLVYDVLDAFFNEGGTEAIVARVVGPNPVFAHVDLLDNVSAVSLHVTAQQYGAWINGYKIVVAGAGPYTITVEDAANNALEQSGSLVTQADAIAWSATSKYVTVTLGVSALIPAPVTATLASGADDYANATDTQWNNAITLFTKDLGPGQVAMPGRTTAAAHANLIAHAVAKNRVALLDYADTGTASTIITAAGTDRLVSGSDSAGAFAPWAIIPGLTNTTTRTVPYSAIAAGIMARNDNAGVSPNQPSAGLNFGLAQYAVGLSQQPWSGTAGGDRELLNNAGVNVARLLNSVVTTYGYRTLAVPTSESALLLLSNRRLVMEIVAKAQAIGDGYVFAQIDGRGLLFADFQGDLAGMLLPYYNERSLFGDTPADAFTVDVGPNVNTANTIAALQLKAVLYLKLSPYAEQVPIQIQSTADTQGVTS